MNGGGRKLAKEKKKKMVATDAGPSLTDPLYDASHPDESTKIPGELQKGVKRNLMALPVP